jgi:hypothetical protein
MKHKIITTSDAILYGLLLIVFGFSLAFIVIYVGLTNGGGCV